MLPLALVYLVFSLLALLPSKSFSAMSATSLSINPVVLKQPLEIALTFTTSTTITDANEIKLTMPGYTRGSCMNKDDGSNELDQTLIKRAPSAKWNAYWYEGTVANSFSDSYFKFAPATGVTIGANTVNTIIVDRAIKVKRNCGDKSTESHVLTDEALATTTLASVDVTAFSGGCYFTDTRVDVSIPLDKTWMEVSVSFKPAMNILGGEAVIFNMAGFTNSNFTGLDKAGLTVSTCTGGGGCNDNTLSILDKTQDDLFKAVWLEGTPLSTDRHLAGYVNSTLILMVHSGKTLLAGTAYTATIDRETSKIGTLCSLPEDYDKITIRTNATLGVVSPVSVIHTDAVGSGCKDYGDCSGHGSCDFCTETCICEKEYGGEGALVDLDISPRCDQKVCPAGYAWGTMPTSTNMGHELMECSNAGTCDRSKGVCICFDGFAGSKCERRECPVHESKVCAGHGTCLSMHQLSMKPDALPLSDPTYNGHNYDNTNGRTWPIYGGGREGDIISGNVTWDERTMYRCHCDSSWAVGLGNGERQLPEYFGPACQFRRCPSGDDPLTHSTGSNVMDERDCNGVVAEGGKGTGKAGNICHVDCSNRGLCDYETGICTCFRGFWGSACELQKDLDIGGAGE